ncbi:MAG: hypothetical protein JEZ04_04910 [Spirochaetales bacterium]|nr:hypothetical protein [Spirochaetales bacterium]
MQKSVHKKNPAILFIYFIPGTVYFIFNSLFARSLARLTGVDSRIGIKI